MKLKFNKQGTAILLAILVMSILLLTLTAIWRSVSLSYEGAMMHYEAKKNFYASESLIIYGIFLIKKNLVPIEELRSDKFRVVYQGNWPKQAKNWGLLLARYDDKQLELQATLFKSDQLRPIINTKVICKKNDDVFEVLDWRNS